MVDFSNVAASKVTGQTTAQYELYDIDMEGATLTVAPATRSNKAYNAALLRLMIPQQRRIAGGKVNADFIEKYRQDLIPLYAKHIVKGWDNIVDSAGNEVDPLEDNVVALLTALPAQTFDGLTEFCENESSFRSLNSGETAKN